MELRVSRWNGEGSEETEGPDGTERDQKKRRGTAWNGGHKMILRVSRWNGEVKSLFSPSASRPVPRHPLKSLSTQSSLSPPSSVPLRPVKSLSVPSSPSPFSLHTVQSLSTQSSLSPSRQVPLHTVQSLSTKSSLSPSRQVPLSTVGRLTLAGSGARGGAPRARLSVRACLASWVYPGRAREPG